MPALVASPSGSIPANCAMRTSTIRLATKMRMAGSIHSGSRVVTCPGFAAYQIIFPEEGGDTVRITIDDDNWGWPNDQFDLIEAMEDERFGWLWEYAAAHGLKLQWVDDATYQPRFEGEAITL